jgi:hypothetical protein
MTQNGKRMYHLYSQNGFEASAKTLESALRAAQRMANKAPRGSIDVVETDIHGMSGTTGSRRITTVEPKRRGGR